MKKIPTLFVRNPHDRRFVIDEVHPDCRWVLDGEGQATLKWDGTCMMLDDNGDWWARREVKPGKTPPPNWVEADTDTVTGKRMGWEPIGQSSFVKFWREAALRGSWNLGTYELVGPKINGNPHGLDGHELIEHGTDFVSAPRNFTGLRDALLDEGFEHEGLVWWHEDGRKAKLKVKDFQ